MNTNPVVIITAGVGALLIYSSIRGYNPIDVLKFGIGGPPPQTIGEREQDRPGRDRMTPTGPGSGGEGSAGGGFSGGGGGTTGSFSAYTVPYPTNASV